MEEKEDYSFREFLSEKGVDLSPELKPRKKRGSLRDSVRRLREMNLGLAALAAALLAAGAAVWKVERPGRADERGGHAVELVFDCSLPPEPGPARAERRRTRPADPAELPPARAARPDGTRRTASGSTGTRAAGSAVHHVVRPGDTLIGIAKKYYGRGWRWTEIARANPQAAADSWKLPVGTKLLIPAARE